MLDTESLYQYKQQKRKQNKRKEKTMNRNSITLGIIPVSVRTTIKTDSKGNNTTKTAYDKWALVGYYTDKSGKQIRAPFAQLQGLCGMARENLDTVGSRDKLMSVAYTLSATGFNLKPYIKGGVKDAVARLKDRAEKAVKRTEKTIADGKEAYLATVKANGEKAWDTMPDKLAEKKGAVKELDGILSLIK